MVLGDGQIERYSRQIIVPRIGGRAQERLLASRLLLAGSLEAITGPLAYLVGAGVGTIRLAIADDPSGVADLAAKMGNLNPDVIVSAGLNDGVDAGNDLLFAILSGNPALDAIRALPERVLCGPSVTARLDNPPRMAVLPSPAPCLRCAADGELLAPFCARDENSGFPTMLACVEALKLLAGYEPATAPSIIEFDGYVSRVKPAASAQGARCACGGGAK
jgi:hypothetical protein